MEDYDEDKKTRQVELSDLYEKVKLDYKISRQLRLLNKRRSIVVMALLLLSLILNIIVLVKS